MDFSLSPFDVWILWQDLVNGKSIYFIYIIYNNLFDRLKLELDENEFSILKLPMNIDALNTFH